MKKFLVFIFSILFISGYSQEKKLVILHTNDMHSQIESYEPTDSGFKAGKGGMVRIATYINKVKETEKNVLVLDAGDFSQETPYYNVYSGDAEIAMMNVIGYDVATLGNHEFDLGLENLKRLIENANFPFVNANYDFTGTPLEGLVTPYKIINIDGIKVGVFGLGVELTKFTFKDNYKGIKFNDIFTTADKYADLLKNKLNCDLVICLSHIGYQSGKFNDAEVAKKSTNIDLIIGGHSHTLLEVPQEVKNKNGKTVYIGQTGSRTLHVGRIDIVLDEVNNRVEVNNQVEVNN